MEPRLAASTLLEAMGELTRWHDLLDAARLEQFVSGSLRSAVSRRLGSLPAADVTERISQMLALVRQTRGAEPRDTREVPFVDGPVRVLLVGRTAKLGIPLRVEMGGDGIALAHAADLDGIRVLLDRLVPEVVVVDAVQPPDVTVAELLAVLGEIPRGTGVILWGSEESWASPLLQSRLPISVDLVTLEHGVGMEPLLDIVRARRSLAAPPAV